jgi:hypothetical protein
MYQFGENGKGKKKRWGRRKLTFPELVTYSNCCSICGGKFVVIFVFCSKLI